MPIPARSFYFLRHGQTAWNVAGRFQGHSDIPLNELGLAQAYDAAKILANCPIDLIVASPLIRARRTAEIVSEQLGKPLLLDDELLVISDFIDSVTGELDIAAFDRVVMRRERRLPLC